MPAAPTTPPAPSSSLPPPQIVPSADDQPATSVLPTPAVNQKVVPLTSNPASPTADAKRVATTLAADVTPRVEKVATPKVSGATLVSDATTPATP
jgi:hypothetical protein